MPGNNCLNYFLFILGKKDYSCAEITKKGLEKNYSKEEVQANLKVLIERNFVNDLRLAENIIHSYQSKKGINWIQQKLKTRLVNPEIINTVLAQNEPTPDLAKLKQKLIRKYKIQDFSQIDYPLKNKLVGYLSNHGFRNAYQLLADLEAVKSDETIF
jgi:regulatory protein